MKSFEEMDRAQAAQILNEYAPYIVIKRTGDTPNDLVVRLDSIAAQNDEAGMRQIENRIQSALHAFGATGHFCQQSKSIAAFIQTRDEDEPTKVSRHGVVLSELADAGVNFPGSEQFRSPTPPQ